MIRVLLFQPDSVLRQRVKEVLEKQIFWVVETGSQEEAYELIRKQHFSLCVWSITPESLSEFEKIKQSRIETFFICTSSDTSPAFIVSCIQAGACDFWPVQASPESFDVLLSRILNRLPSQDSSLVQMSSCDDFIGKHPSIVEIYDVIERIKDSDSNVLILGESGTGKEVVARAIHSQSKRSKKPFVAVNCGAIPANLLESELFGHVKGAFTGAVQNRIGRFQGAKDGTLFLDEIVELPIDLQSKLLRAIQQRLFEPVGSIQSIKLEARLIAATNQELEKAVIDRRFREDLFYRLNVIPIRIPPLRNRKSDIPLLVKRFLDKFNQLNGKEISGISEEAMRSLMSYHWPGNIRELENLIERVVVLKKGADRIELKDFPVNYFSQVRLDRFVANISLPEEGIDFNDAVDEFENELILQALQKTSGNKNQAAHLLKLNRTTLIEKLKRKGLRIQ